MMNRLQMYDWLRRELGIKPPIDLLEELVAAGELIDDDLLAATVGLCPEWRPYPGNALLKQAINNAARAINRRVGFETAPAYVQIPIAAQTANGPVSVSLRGPLVGAQPGSVQQVRRAWWETSGGTRTRLWPTTREGLIDEDTENVAPSTPQRFWIEGYRVHLTPANSAAGTLLMLAGIGFVELADDFDGFDQLPDSYADCPLYPAMVELGKIMADDAEMRARALAFQPEANQGYADIADWAANVNEEAQPAMGLGGGYRRR